MDCNDLDNFSRIARDHAENPRNYGALGVFDSHARITGPCGDCMEFWLAVRNGQVERASFVTDGCGPSLASGSMATSLARGKYIGDVMRISQRDIFDALGGLPAESEHCPLLASNTLKAACENYLEIRSRSPEDKTKDENLGNPGHSTLERKPEKSGEQFEEQQKLQSRLCRIRHKVVVLSGKGGVGKSTVAVNLATSLASAGKRVGLLDVDIHGPSVPTMLGLEQERVVGNEDSLFPVALGNLKVMSLGFLLASQDDAVIWRGPKKMGVIKQFLSDVEWGDLDYLIIDSPPGTGDEPLSVCQLIGNLDGAVVVTTPQKVAAVDVRKSITFCRQLQLPVIGVVENMNGFTCPKCGEVTQILSSGGGRQIAADMGITFLGAIPIDPRIAEAGDKGKAFVQHYAETPTAKLMQDIIQPIIDLDESIYS
jgi:ATP-binding protein involved in chromosome partitioning